MLAYSFEVLNEKSYHNIREETFDNIGDLFTAILGQGILNQIKRGLGKEYIENGEFTSKPRGKINISESIKSPRIIKKDLYCHIDEFTENEKLNQIIKSTGMLLLKAKGVKSKHRKTLKKALFYLQDVKLINLKKIQWSAIRYHRNNSTYKMLINLCYLIYKGSLMKEDDGGYKLSKFIDDQKMYKLFEKFVLAYYKKHHPDYRPSSPHVKWDTDDDFVKYLPTMKTDIALHNGQKTLIIDTKFYGTGYQHNKLFDSRSVHSGNLYQIYSYVKNYDSNNSGSVQGMLLYAVTDSGNLPKVDYSLSGNRISVYTIDLNKPFSEIESQLDSLLRF